MYPAFDHNVDLSDDQRIAELRKRFHRISNLEILGSSQARQLANSQPPKNVHHF